ncbi:hypothetical protein SAMN04489737_0709 [Arcanobacterium phocae]|uniref:Uncharacterized protein n=1 Tax=Arcanobacterium phocae TaxID=131112 RepID=A0A1H2LDF0_9ACTO|nr:hypothetical protein [Arcanobacterium phocae]SDU79023.1 hypothetical protein SAMN04489737_0709 [Arcanobacterium phocae]
MKISAFFLSLSLVLSAQFGDLELTSNSVDNGGEIGDSGRQVLIHPDNFGASNGELDIFRDTPSNEFQPILPNSPRLHDISPYAIIPSIDIGGGGASYPRVSPKEGCARARWGNFIWSVAWGGLVCAPVSVATGFGGFLCGAAGSAASTWLPWNNICR